MYTTDELFKQEEKKPRNRLKIFLWVVAIIFILIAAAAGAIYTYVTGQLKPVKASPSAVRFTIPQGVGSGQIANLLEQNGLIRSSMMFQYYLRYKQQGDRFQAGEYEMAPGLTLDQIIAKLNAGDTVKEEMLRFTIPEGFTIRQIADKLSQEGIANKDEVLRLANEPERFANYFVKEIPANKELIFKLEGYLFPETYEMKKNSNSEDIVARMILELDNKLQQLPAGWQERLTQLGIDFHQMMTIASLVEREVVVDDERALVAGVIYNRIKEKMKLQIDATVQYLLDKPKERLIEKDLLEAKSPYNTYLNEGLPPGPIASPSLKSIEAALYPEESKYLFYVTKKDGSQKHLFAETYKQHQKNIAASKAEAGKSSQ